MHEEMKMISWPLRVIFQNEHLLITSKCYRSPLQRSPFSICGSLHVVKYIRHILQQARLASLSCCRNANINLVWQWSRQFKATVLSSAWGTALYTVKLEVLINRSDMRQQNSGVIHCNNQTTALIVSDYAHFRLQWALWSLDGTIK